MLVDLSDVLSSYGKVETMSVPLEMTSFQSGMGDFPITQASPLTLVFTNIGEGRAKLKGDAKLVFQARCDRCLRQAPLPMELSFEEEVSVPGGAEDEVFACLDGERLDVEMLAYDEILMNWPMKILCREDCKGVCPVCGKDLNEGDCGCDRFVPDPRLAAIQEIFNANKEV